MHFCTHNHISGKILRVTITDLIAMRLIAPLSPETTKLLWRIYRQSNRCNSATEHTVFFWVLKGLSIGQLMQIFDVVAKRFITGLWHWEAEVSGIMRPSRTRTQTHVYPRAARTKWKNGRESPKQLKRKYCKQLTEEWKIKVSKDTIKRVIKSLSMRLAKGAPSRWWQTWWAGVYKRNRNNSPNCEAGKGEANWFAISWWKWTVSKPCIHRSCIELIFGALFEVPLAF
jgi:ubiquinone biosynthesis protein UbiJ